MSCKEWIKLYSINKKIKDINYLTKNKGETRTSRSLERMCICQTPMQWTNTVQDIRLKYQLFNKLQIWDALECKCRNGKIALV